MRVEFLLDPNLADEDASGIISEHAVAPLLSFHTTLQEFISYESFLQDVDLGCVLLGFLVRIPDFVATAKAYSVTAEEVRPALISQKLRSKTWDDVCQRFAVAESHVPLH